MTKHPPGSRCARRVLEARRPARPGSAGSRSCCRRGRRAERPVEARRRHVADRHRERVAAGLPRSCSTMSGDSSMPCTSTPRAASGSPTLPVPIASSSARAVAACAARNSTVGSSTSGRTCRPTPRRSPRDPSREHDVRHRRTLLATGSIQRLSDSDGDEHLLGGVRRGPCARRRRSSRRTPSPVRVDDGRRRPGMRSRAATSCRPSSSSSSFSLMRVTVTGPGSASSEADACAACPPCASCRGSGCRAGRSAGRRAARRASPRRRRRSRAPSGRPRGGPSPTRAR